MHHVHALLPAIAFLLAGALAITLTRPMGQSPIVGYLAAGLLIGPHGLGLIQASETTALLAELGVVFLLFDIGLHFSLGHIWDARRDILGLGPVQILLCTAAFAALGWLAGLEPVVATVVGATLALSSTAVVIQTLAERRQQSCPLGVTATAVLIFQDICAIFLLILAASLAGDQATLPLAVGAAVVKGTLAFAAALLIGRHLASPLLGLLTGARNEELFTAAALLIVLLAAAATGALGLSLTLGAFLGGMIIAETPYRHAVQTEVKPFRGLLLGFFFITVGMSLDLGVVMAQWMLILAVVVVLVLVKALFVGLAAVALHAPLRSAVQLGFLLSQGSEFAFVILGMPALKATIGPEMAAVLVTAVAASLALTPSLTSLGYGVVRRLARGPLAARSPMECAGEAQPGEANPVAPVVIFGMGTLGRKVADALEAHHIAYLAIEMDPERFVKATADGYPVAYGDAGDLRMMETIQMSDRPAIVITIRRYEVSRDLTPVVRQRYPNLARIIGVESEEDRERFEALGMRAVVDRSIPRGLDLAATVLRQHGIAEDRIHAWMRRQQDQALELTPAPEAA